MGSDRSPKLLLEAAVEVFQELEPTATLVVIGKPSLCDPGGILSAVQSGRWEGLEFVSAPEEIRMDEPPLYAIRRKRDASMVRGLQMLRSKQLDAFVSAGSTGALIAGARFFLPTLPQIDRPALLAVLPTLEGSVAVVDVGGSVDPTPSQILQFARMGVAYQKASAALVAPRVGLLNIGTEAIKGTQGLQEAHRLLEEAAASTNLTFIGNIEGREVFQGGVDVLVCGGFAGNIFLKTAEGISTFILQSLRCAFGEAINEQVEGVLQEINQKVNYAEYPGAIVCGVEGVLVKCHGYSCKQAMKNGIRGALRLCQEELVEKMKAELL